MPTRPTLHLILNILYENLERKEEATLENLVARMNRYDKQLKVLGDTLNLMNEKIDTSTKTMKTFLDKGGDKN